MICISLFCTVHAAAFNPIHLQRLKDNNSCFSCDLSGANLSGAILKYAKLRYANLSGADLSGANLEGARLKNWIATKGAIWTNGCRCNDYECTNCR